MQVGKLDKRVTFERYATTYDNEGSAVKTWTPIFKRWAYINITNATETFKNEQDFTTRTGFLICRIDSSTGFLTTEDRVVYKGIPYEIMGILDIDERGEFYEIAIQKLGS